MGRMAASYGRRYVQITTDLPEDDWSGLGSFAMSELGETLARSAAWVSSCILCRPYIFLFPFFLLLITVVVIFLVQAYTVALRFADSADNLSAPCTERDRLVARAQELERELNETKDKLSRVQTKLSNSLLKRKKVVAKATEL